MSLQVIREAVEKESDIVNNFLSQKDFNAIGKLEKMKQNIISSFEYRLNAFMDSIKRCL